MSNNNNNKQSRKAETKQNQNQIKANTASPPLKKKTHTEHTIHKRYTTQNAHITRNTRKTHNTQHTKHTTHTPSPARSCAPPPPVRLGSEENGRRDRRKPGRHHRAHGVDTLHRGARRRNRYIPTILIGHFCTLLSDILLFMIGHFSQYDRTFCSF